MMLDKIVLVIFVKNNKDINKINKYYNCNYLAIIKQHTRA